MDQLQTEKLRVHITAQIGVGLSGRPSSVMIVFIQLAWREQSDNAIYSASVEDSAIVFCARDCQLIIPLANLNK